MNTATAAHTSPARARFETTQATLTRSRSDILDHCHPLAVDAVANYFLFDVTPYAFEKCYDLDARGDILTAGAALLTVCMSDDTDAVTAAVQKMDSVLILK